jgi:hypothetical protein
LFLMVVMKKTYKRIHMYLLLLTIGNVKCDCIIDKVTSSERPIPISIPIYTAIVVTHWERKTRTECTVAW